jgi:hypothetical protein
MILMTIEPPLGLCANHMRLLARTSRLTLPVPLGPMTIFNLLPGEHGRKKMENMLGITTAEYALSSSLQIHLQSATLTRFFFLTYLGPGRNSTSSYVRKFCSLIRAMEPVL